MVMLLSDNPLPFENKNWKQLCPAKLCCFDICWCLWHIFPLYCFVAMQINGIKKWPYSWIATLKCQYLAMAIGSINGVWRVHLCFSTYNSLQYNTHAHKSWKSNFLQDSCRFSENSYLILWPQFLLFNLSIYECNLESPGPTFCCMRAVASYLPDY